MGAVAEIAITMVAEAVEILVPEVSGERNPVVVAFLARQLRGQEGKIYRHFGQPEKTEYFPGEVEVFVVYRQG